MTLAATLNQFKFDFFRNHAELCSPSLVDYDSLSPYEILGVRRNATMTDIKRTWRKLMMANHPDLGGDLAKTMALNDAYKEICKRRGA